MHHDPSVQYQRLAFKMKLKPGFKAEYIRRHAEIWPALAELLKHSGIEEYSIFLDEETNTLFAIQKVNGNIGSQDLGKNPIVQQWWKFMADIMDTNADYSPMSQELEEVFYLR